jgi:hypothetical protein
VSQRSKRWTKHRVVCQAALKPGCMFVGYRTRNLRAPCPRCGDKVQVLR